MSMLKKVRVGIRTAQDFGLQWAYRRLLYELKLRVGYNSRRMPKKQWQEKEWDNWVTPNENPAVVFERWKSNGPNFIFDLESRETYANTIQQIYSTEGELPEVLGKKTISHSDVPYYSKHKVNISLPQDWFNNPFQNGQKNQLDPSKHWSFYPMKGEPYEDLKHVWEYGRFNLVYVLVRNYTVTGNPRNAELFWETVESWANNNPPNTGPHWKCGQETSLRLMAWCFGLYAFKDLPATTPRRFYSFLGWVGAQAHRISLDLEYSYLQHSNHAVSEGLGLFMVGLLFPQLKYSKTWKDRGKYILEERSKFLIRPDGTYIQKSHNYLRFILHAYIFVIRLAESNNETLSKDMYDRVKASYKYLLSVFDEESGKVPNFGSNDGALILPLSSTDFTDYRPILEVLHFQFTGKMLFETGPWSEDLIWLFGPSSLAAPVTDFPFQKSDSFETGGIYTIRKEESWSFTHAESFKDRPAHADALGVDLWWKGINIAPDPGTYLYYGKDPWMDPFKHTGYHNTVTINGKDQMERGHRFTWAYWHKSKLEKRVKDSSKKIEYIELNHTGYLRLKNPVVHKRAIISIGKDRWMVVDDLIGKGIYDTQLHWLLRNFPYTITGNSISLNTPKGTYCLSIYNETMPTTSRMDVLLGADDNNPRGWLSEYYYFKEPAISINFANRGSLPFRFLSVFGPMQQYEFNDNQPRVYEFPSDGIKIVLNETGEEDIIREIIKI